jgi:hypothetical protein
MGISANISGPIGVTLSSSSDKVFKAPNGELFAFGETLNQASDPWSRILHRRGLNGVWDSTHSVGAFYPLVHFEMVGNTLDVYTSYRSADANTYYVEKNFSPLYSITSNWSSDVTPRDLFVAPSGDVWVAATKYDGSTYYPVFFKSGTYVELRLDNIGWSNGQLVHRKWKNSSNVDQERMLIGYCNGDGKYLATVDYAAGTVISNLTSSLESALTGFSPTGMQLCGNGFINDSDITNYLKFNGDGYQYVGVTNSGAHLVTVPFIDNSQVQFTNDKMFGIDWTGPAYELRKSDPTDASGLTFGSDSMLIADELLYDLAQPVVSDELVLIMGLYEAPRTQLEFIVWEEPAPSLPTSVAGVTTISDADDGSTDGKITLTENMTVEATGDLTLNVTQVSDLAGGKIIEVKPGGKIHLTGGLTNTVISGHKYMLKT